MDTKEFNHPLAPGNFTDVAEKVEHNLAELHRRWAEEAAAKDDWRAIPDPFLG